MLGTAEGGGLVNLKSAAIDQHAVVDHLVWLERLEDGVGIHAGAGPLAAAQVAGADEHSPVDLRRNDV